MFQTPVDYNTNAFKQKIKTERKQKQKMDA